MFINTTTGEIAKPRYRFRQCLATGEVRCLSGSWPPPKPNMPPKYETIYDTPQVKLEPTKPKRQAFKLAKFPNQAGWCPKCRGRGVVISQATRKPMGVCFWCDGKGKLDENDLRNQQRRQRLGLPTDFRAGL